jgi:hypothetical protein
LPGVGTALGSGDRRTGNGYNFKKIASVQTHGASLDWVERADTCYFQSVSIAFIPLAWLCFDHLDTIFDIGLLNLMAKFRPANQQLADISDNMRILYGCNQIVPVLHGINGTIEFEHVDWPGKMLKLELMLAAHDAYLSNLSTRKLKTIDWFIDHT